MRNERRGFLLLAACLLSVFVPAQVLAGEWPDLREAGHKALRALEKNPKTLRCTDNACEHELSGLIALPGRRPSVAVLTITYPRGGCAMCERVHSFFLYQWHGGGWKLKRAKLAFHEQPFGGVKWSMLESGGKTVLLQRAFFGRDGRTGHLLVVHDMSKGVPEHADDFCIRFSNRGAVEGMPGARVEDWRAVLREGRGGDVILEIRDKVSGNRTVSRFALKKGKFVPKGRTDPRLLNIEHCLSMF